MARTLTRNQSHKNREKGSPGLAVEGDEVLPAHLVNLLTTHPLELLLDISWTISMTAKGPPIFPRHLTQGK